MKRTPFIGCMVTMGAIAAAHPFRNGLELQRGARSATDAPTVAPTAAPTSAPSLAVFAREPLPYAYGDLDPNALGDPGIPAADVEAFYDGPYLDAHVTANAALASLDAAMNAQNIEDTVTAARKLVKNINRIQNYDLIISSVGKPFGEDCYGCPPYGSVPQPPDAATNDCPSIETENITTAINQYFTNWTEFQDAVGDKAANPDAPGDNIILVVAKYSTMEKPADEVEMNIVTIKDSDSLWERHGYLHTYMAGHVDDYLGAKGSATWHLTGIHMPTIQFGADPCEAAHPDDDIPCGNQL
eukprot:m.342393 g.342393  ORF g.342393 m.342393 type:complete len:299 (+) comp16548_c0_seq1:493-1389(+)